MPRVHHVKKARKAKKAHGIKVGDSYYWWKTRMKGQRNGTMHYSKTRPRPSQLTMSEYLSTALSIQEDIEDAAAVGIETKDDVQEFADALNQAANDVRELGEETQSKFDNMPEGLQQGETGQLLEQRVQACETIADELENAASELDGWEPAPEDKDPDQPAESAEAEQAQAAVNDTVGNLSWDWEG